MVSRVAGEAAPGSRGAGRFGRGRRGRRHTCRASFKYARLISSAEASFATPRSAYSFELSTCARGGARGRGAVRRGAGVRARDAGGWATSSSSCFAPRVAARAPRRRCRRRRRTFPASGSRPGSLLRCRTCARRARPGRTGSRHRTWLHCEKAGERPEVWVSALAETTPAPEAAGGAGVCFCGCTPTRIDHKETGATIVFAYSPIVPDAVSLDRSVHSPRPEGVAEKGDEEEEQEEQEEEAGALLHACSFLLSSPLFPHWFAHCTRCPPPPPSSSLSASRPSCSRAFRASMSTSSSSRSTT